LSFTLVSNGLQEEEWNQLLNEQKAFPDRITCRDIPTFNCVPHGVALDFLSSETQGEYFAFCDSDIFASGSIDAFIQSAAGPSKILSACVRPESAHHQQLGGYGGSFSLTSSRFPMAASFFCVYPVRAVDHVQRLYKTGFKQINRATQINQKAIDKLESSKITDIAPYDTGKLLSLLAHLDGFEITHSNPSTLHHVGGISGELAKPWDQSCLNIELPNDDPSNKAPKDEARIRGDSEKALKKLLTKYFAALLRHHADGTPRPVLRRGSASKSNLPNLELFVSRLTQTIDESFRS
jgi:hypothetical protein